MKKIFAASIVAALMAGGAHAGDPAEGARVFDSRCKTCHAITDASGNDIVRGGRTGPNLYGVVGRAKGGDEGFARYGDALKQLGAQGVAWTEESIAEYVADPRAYLESQLGGRARSNMAYKLPDATARADVAAYLASVAQ
ncbi:MAG: c-type cytochrome [Rubrimonas sp.]